MSIPSKTPLIWREKIEIRDKHPELYSESLLGNNFSVLWIRDVYPGYRILNFTHPLSRISDPGSKNSNKREG
jgi:hypothetical protein